MSERRKHRHRPEVGGYILLICGVITFLLGASAMAGWIFDVAVLRSISPQFVSMKANTALSFMVLGASLALTVWPGGTLPVAGARFAAAGVIILSSATLVEYLGGWSFGIDNWLIVESSSAFETLHPGRMSPVTALNFILLGVVIVFPHGPSFFARTAPWILLLPLLISARALVGYLYQAPILYQLGPSSMAIHTTGAFIALSVGLLLSRQEYGVITIIQSQAAGGRAARWVLPAVILAPVLTGLVCLQGEAWRWFNGDVGLTIYTSIMCVALVLLVGWAARSLDRMDRQREHSQKVAEELKWTSLCDPLTGALNRRGLIAMGSSHFRRAMQSGTPLALIVADIDHFKKINDTWGHGTGDQVLRQFAEAFRQHCRASDLVCRLGGEEFAVLLPETTEQDAIIVAERLRSYVATHSFSADGRLAVTCSFGVSEFTEHMSELQALADAADTALLVAKRSGRNRVVSALSLNQDSLDADACLRGPWDGLLARDIMAPVTAFLSLTDSPWEAARLLLKVRLDSLPVLDGNGRLYGLVTDQALTADLLHGADSHQTLRQLASRVVITYDESVAAEEVARFLVRSPVSRAVVLRDEVPVGVLSRATLLRWLVNRTVQPTPQRILGAARPPSEELHCALRELAHAASRLAEANHDLTDASDFAQMIAELTRLEDLAQDALANCQASADDDSPMLVASGAASFI
jgi:diguanylate cyclase (GGDEF)-like protein